MISNGAELNFLSGYASNAQLLAIATTPITLIPAPALANQVIRPLRITLWLVSDASSTGLTVSGGATNIGYHPAASHVIAGDTGGGAIATSTVPDSSLTGSGEPILQTFLSTALGNSKSSSVDFLVSSCASATGVASLNSLPALGGKAVELVCSGTVGNGTGSGTTLYWDCTYWVLDFPPT